MNSIKLVFVSDIHFGVDDLYRPGSEVGELMEGFVQLIKEEIRPDAVVELGDRINNVDHEGDAQHLQYILEQLDNKLQIPVFHVLGNHDVVYLKKEESTAIIGEQASWHSFIYRGFKFIMLDTVDPMIANCGGAVSEQQLAWLQEEMNIDNVPKLVFGHHPIDDQTMRSNTTFIDTDMHLNFLENKWEVRRILESGKNYCMYGCGHMHWFSFLCSENGTYITTPSFTEAYPQKTGAPGAFLVVDVYTNGKIEACYRTTNPRRVLGRFTSKE